MALFSFLSPVDLNLVSPSQPVVSGFSCVSYTRGTNLKGYCPFLTDLQKSIILIILKTHLKTFANKLPVFDSP